MGVLNRRYSVLFWRGIVGDFFLVVVNKTWTLWHSVGGGRGCKTAAEMGAAIELEIWRIPLEITLFHFPAADSKELCERGRKRKIEGWILKEWKYRFGRGADSSIDGTQTDWSKGDFNLLKLESKFIDFRIQFKVFLKKRNSSQFKDTSTQAN